MTQFLLILQLINQLFPLLNQTLSVVEQAFPQGGNGAQKLEMVRTVLQNAYSTIQGAPVAFDAVWQTAKPLIDSMVAIKNAIGEFKKSA